jgi:ethanolamine utilization microcompartment shell protein EutS
MARGGQRQGTPGVSYSNRTDLMQDYAPSAGTANAAAGDQAAASWITPDQVPKLDDMTANPDEPVTAGLDIGAGPGASALGGMPTSPVNDEIVAAYMAYPTPELARVINLLRMQGKL